MQDIRKQKIAIVGISRNPEKYGYKIFRDMLQDGLQVMGVNPHEDEVLGAKIYKSLKDLPEVPDLVITVVPPSVTEKIVDECKDLGVKAVWMQPGSESDAAVEKAKKDGINVIYNACFMVQHGIW